MNKSNIDVGQLEGWLENSLQEISNAEADMKRLADANEVMWYLLHLSSGMPERRNANEPFKIRATLEWLHCRPDGDVIGTEEVTTYEADYSPPAKPWVSVENHFKRWVRVELLGLPSNDPVADDNKPWWVAAATAFPP